MGSQWRLAPSAAVEPDQLSRAPQPVVQGLGLARPLPARGAPSLLARRPAPPAEVADPGSAG